MGKTPGFIIPSLYSSKSDLKKDLKRRDDQAGFTPFDKFFAHFSTNNEDAEAFLSHFGIKGMRWGVRNDRPDGVSRSTNREASKDAKEFARAKQFTGEGAGNRRKHIKSTVESKKKKSSSYSRAFNAALESQDVEKHVTKAQRERKRKDVTLKTKQRAGFIARNVTGEMGTQAAFTAVALSGAAFAASPKGKQLFNTTTSNIKRVIQNRQLQRNVTNLINRSR